MLLLLFIIYAIALSIALARKGHTSRATTSDSKLRKRPTRILIVGGTGGTGRELIAAALDRGYTVTALVRDPAKLQVEHPQLTVLQGNVLDESFVDVAMRGQEAVVSALGHKRFFYPTRILSQGTENILRSMQTHNVHRLVCETSLGIGDSAWRMGLYYSLFTIPVILPFYYWDKTRQERAIAKSKVEWVIVRPGALTNFQKRGQIRHGSHVGSLILTARIARADVADFMLNQLETDMYLGAAPGFVW
jgi:putative NADH-flavin reductase